MQQKTTYAALALGSLMLVPLAQAEPLSLSPGEMDSVTAGQSIGIELIAGGAGGTGGTGGEAHTNTTSVAGIEANCGSNCTVSAGAVAGAAASAFGGTGGTGGTGGRVVGITLDLGVLNGVPCVPLLTC